MDRYLKLVFEWDKDLLTFIAYLELPKQQDAMGYFMAGILTDSRRRKIAEIQIENSVLAFESELDRPDMFLSDPVLIDRWMALLSSALACVPKRRPWVKAKILLWRMRRLARATRVMREQILSAHFRFPAQMALPSEPVSVSTLCFPN